MRWQDKIVAADVAVRALDMRSSEIWFERAVGFSTLSKEMF
jgi:hypothetical protein